MTDSVRFPVEILVKQDTETEEVSLYTNDYVYEQSIFVRLIYGLQNKLLFRIIKYKETKIQSRVKI